MIAIIARKELRSLFATPMGWLVLAIVQAIVGTYYSLSFNQYFEIMQSAQWQVQRIGLTQFMAEGVFGVAAVLMLFVVPLVSMKLISEERKNQTMVLLMSAPLSMSELVLGKLLGIDCVERARTEGYLAMQFNYVVSSNMPAVLLWKKLGFSIVGTLPRAYRHQYLGYVDVYVMYQLLEDPTHWPDA